MRIERKNPRCPSGERPYLTKDGHYILGDLGLGDRLWHLAENAIHAKTIAEAVQLIETRHMGIRMHCVGKRPSLIRPSGLRIIRP